MRALHVASEVAPYSQSGGLAQVAGALPRALRSLGIDVSVLTPLYRCVRERVLARGSKLQTTAIGFDVELFGRRYHGEVFTTGDGTFFVDCPPLYDREGLYADDNKVAHPDNASRFAFLARAAAMVGDAVCSGAPDIVHAHDWQTGLVAAYLRLAGKPSPKTVFTIHNLAFQGIYSKDHIDGLGLDWSLFTVDGLEFYDQVNFLKAGASFSDHITTVSPTYADEITRLEFGQALDGYFRHHRSKLSGLLNGIDNNEWNPTTDRRIAANYSDSDRSGKRACRHALARRFEIEIDEQTLLLGVVSRLTEQKGPDEIAAVAAALDSLGAALVVLGSGDAAIEAEFRALAAANPKSISAYIGFDEPLAHQVFAGCDALLMPSRFEPCGLAQLSAMRYGTLPIVRAVGGLADSVTDNETGFSYGQAGSLLSATRRAAMVARDQNEHWQHMIGRAMRRDSSWRLAATGYVDLYRRLLV